MYSDEKFNTLMAHEDEEFIPRSRERYVQDMREKKNLHRIQLAVVCVINVCLVAVIVIMAFRDKFVLSDPSMVGVYSPARSAVEYQIHRFESAFYNKTEYMGLPSPALDKKWNDLTSLTISKINDEEASKLFEPTMSNLDNPSEHLIILDVFHQIHCLNSIRKAFYPEYYPFKREFLANGTENKDTMTWKHLDHCIDSIRQSLMCSGDISPVVYHIDPRGTGVFPKLQGTHVCRNYDKLKEWAREHDASDVRFLFQEGDALLDYYRTDPEGFMRKGGSE